MAGARPARRRLISELGRGLIAGAADVDPSAIGTFASAGARFGPGMLWAAPAVFPMMFTVVYLSSKLGMVTGKGLFAAISDNYPRWVLYAALIGVMIGNTIQAAADIGGMSAALSLLLPGPGKWIVVATTLSVLSLQVWGSYRLIRNTFRWMTLALLTYVGAALLARPDLREVVRATLIPQLQLSREYLSLLLAIFGSSLSTYLVTWKANEEVEEEIAAGRVTLANRRGATREELARSRRDVLFGMLFANLIMYSILLATSSTLYKAGTREISTAAQAASALEPVAGGTAQILFVLGIVGVGFLAVPVTTTGIAYNLCQAAGWKSGLGLKPRQAKAFYIAIVLFTALAMGLNFFAINPMKALVWAGIVQGFSLPPLLLLIVLMTSSRKVMGERVNSRTLSAAGWVTVAVVFASSCGVIVSWFL